jgi:hypothetical protein
VGAAEPAADLVATGTDVATAAPGTAARRRPDGCDDERATPGRGRVDDQHVAPDHGSLDDRPRAPSVRPAAQLAFAMEQGLQYFVDDVRFIVADPELVRAAFDDYADFVSTGAFGIETPGEPTVEVLAENLAIVERLRAELARRAAAGERLPALTDLVRYSVNHVPGSDRVIPALRAALGPHARFSIDAYSTDPAIWERIMALFGVVDGRADPAAAYDLELALPMSSWVDRESGAPRSPDVTAELLDAYLAIAARYRTAGVGGVMLFTGFAAADNIHDDHFEGTVLQKRTFEMVAAALECDGRLFAESAAP